jgi:hypothetical protein
MVTKYVYLYFPFQGPPKFTRIAIFGLKTKHLATLIGANENDNLFENERDDFFSWGH